jgi:competence protein ComEC
LALLVALLAAQAAGILLADRVGLDPRFAWATVATSLAAGLALRSTPMRVACALLAVAAASAGALATRLDGAARDRPSAPIEATLEGTVVTVAQAFGETEVELARAVATAGETQRVPSRLRVRSRPDGRAAQPLADALPGDRLRLRARLRTPEARANPGGRDRTRALERRGVGAVGALVHSSLAVRVPEREGWRPLAGVHAFRAATSRRLRAEGEGGALLAALALGDRGGLDLARRAEFRQLGVTHILSVSGLHLALAAAGAFRLLLPPLRRARAVRDARRASLALAAATAAAYAVLAGFEVPVQRSLAMLLALAAGMSARRPVRRLAPLACAALGILAFDPAALFDAGAQMSFLASAALLLGVARAPGDDAPPRSAIADLLHTSALATAATAPVAATLGSVSPWGLVANAVAVPWTGLVLMPVSFAATAFAALGSIADPALHLAARVADASLAALRFAAEWTPPAWDADPGPLAIAAASVAALLLLLATRNLPARMIGAIAIALALAAAPPPAIDPAPPRVVALDVGQGDATLVQGRRAAVLVDGGTALPGGGDLGASAVVPALRALGVERLDLVAASHGDLDHRGGLAAVLRAIPTDALWLPLGGLADPAFAALVGIARERGVAVAERGAGDAPLVAGDLVVTPLWPLAADARGSRNDRSLVLRVDAGDRSVLLAGDLEGEAERALVASGAALRADVLKLPHHGSRTSSTRALLDTVGAQVAIASAPRFGRFGMPHESVVERVRAAGVSLWWTGRDGAVLVSIGEPLWVRGWREIRRASAP